VAAAEDDGREEMRKGLASSFVDVVVVFIVKDVK
jgi:hypothetical protein